jgi:hypothetical protein
VIFVSKFIPLSAGFFNKIQFPESFWNPETGMGV